MKGPFSVFSSPRIRCLLLLGFASGLPFALTSDTLQAWLSQSHVDLTHIGLFGLVALPYTLKFLWAPFMDRYVPPLLGRRRGWLLITQILTAGAILAVAVTDPTHSAKALAVAALFLAFFSASQDIVGDAYRTDVLDPDELAAGAAVWVTGYRLAVLVSGAGVLLLVGRFNFSFAAGYAMIAALLFLSIFITIISPEPARHPTPPRTLTAAVVEPLRELLLRPRGLLILLFVILFTLPEVLAKGMTLPFMLDIGIPLTEIAKLRQVLGILMTILGTLAGGAIAARLGLWRSLWLFALLGALSNLGFFFLAEASASSRYAILVASLTIESFCAGLVTAGFLAFLMSQCDARYSATQYALLSSLMRLTDVLSRPPGGYLAAHLGWPGFFTLTVFAALPGLLLLYFIQSPPASPILPPTAGQSAAPPRLPA